MSNVAFLNTLYRPRESEKAHHAFIQAQIKNTLRKIESKCGENKDLFKFRKARLHSLLRDQMHLVVNSDDKR